MAQSTGVPLSNDQVRDEIRKFGLPNELDKVGKSLRVIRSTQFYEEGSTLAPVRMFTQKAVLDGYWNTFVFPQQETAVVVRGIAIDHQLQFNATVPEISHKQQAIFEQTSFLRLKYRRRSDRISLRVSDLVAHSFAPNGLAVNQYFKPLSAHQNAFWMLPDPVLLAPLIEIEWLVDIQSGFTLAANSATGDTATPTLPNSGLTGAGNYLSLILLIEELFEAQG